MSEARPPVAAGDLRRALPGPGLPRRVLMTTDAVGGVWDYSLELARGLTGAGVQVILAVLGPPADAAQLASAAAIPLLGLHSYPGRLEWMDNPWADVDRARRGLAQLAEEAAVDLVHVNGYAYATAGFSVPSLVVAHSCVLSWWRAVKGEAAPAAWGHYRDRVTHGIEAASHVVAPTQTMLESIQHEYDAHQSYEVIGNGRDARDWALARPKRACVLSAGRLWDPAKNTAVLARIADRLPWPIKLAGADTAAGAAAGRAGQTKAGDASAPVIRLGRLSPRALAEEYASASIYALPALYEPFGLSVLEAALAGCALLLGDIPSLRELWQGAAMFVDPSDDAAVADGLCRLIVNRPYRMYLAAEARRRADGYSAARMVQAYLDRYRTLLGTELGTEMETVASAGAQKGALACAS